MKQKIIQNIKLVIIGALVAVGVSYATASYNAPKCGAPGCNIDETINVGSKVQQKNGALTLMHVFTSDLTVTNGDGSNITPGYVLTAVDATGKAEWRPAQGN